MTFINHFLVREYDGFTLTTFKRGDHFRVLISKKSDVNKSMVVIDAADGQYPYWAVSLAKQRVDVINRFRD